MAIVMRVIYELNPPPSYSKVSNTSIAFADKN